MLTIEQKSVKFNSFVVITCQLGVHQLVVRKKVIKRRKFTDHIVIISFQIRRKTVIKIE